MNLNYTLNFLYRMCQVIFNNLTLFSELFGLSQLQKIIQMVQRC